jgi:hypothetical protein
MDDHQLSNNITKLIEKNETMASATFQCEIITFNLKNIYFLYFFPFK